MGDSEGFVPREILDQVPWREYVAARYGFRNHWYPALLSSVQRQDDDRRDDTGRAGRLDAPRRAGRSR